MIQYDAGKDRVVMHPADYERLRSIEAAARKVIAEAWPDLFPGHEPELLDELRVIGPMEALEALRAALALEGK